MDFQLFFQGLLLGIGLSMDACAISMSNGLKEPNIKLNKIIFISFMFGLFQGLMPLIGYLIGHNFVEYFEKYIPWIALILLLILGIKMIIEAIRKKDDHEEKRIVTYKEILVQTIATSIDALSVGVTIADYKFTNAIITFIIISICTFFICFIAHFVGKKFGNKFQNKAEIFGGVILIIIGLEIFIKGMFF